MSTIISNPVNSESPNGTLGIIPKVGSVAIGGAPISADVDLPEIAYLFRSGDTGTSNTLILEGADGNPVAFLTNISRHSATKSNPVMGWHPLMNRFTYLQKPSSAPAVWIQRPSLQN